MMLENIGHNIMRDARRGLSITTVVLSFPVMHADRSLSSKSCVIWDCLQPWET